MRGIRWRWLLFASAALGVLLLAAHLVQSWTASPINPANLDRIKQGMSRAAVEDLLGGPPGDYRTDQRISFDMGETGKAPMRQGKAAHYWTSDRYLIRVGFNENGNVVAATGYTPYRRPWHVAIADWLPWLK